MEFDTEVLTWCSTFWCLFTVCMDLAEKLQPSTSQWYAKTALWNSRWRARSEGILHLKRKKLLRWILIQTLQIITFKIVVNHVTYYVVECRYQGANRLLFYLPSRYSLIYVKYDLWKVLCTCLEFFCFNKGLSYSRVRMGSKRGEAQVIALIGYSHVNQFPAEYRSAFCDFSCWKYIQESCCTFENLTLFKIAVWLVATQNGWHF